MSKLLAKFAIVDLDENGNPMSATAVSESHAMAVELDPKRQVLVPLMESWSMRVCLAVDGASLAEQGEM